MSQAQVSTSGLVRVTVTSGTRRVDLVLPGAVPVVELLPELARSVGMLDSATTYGGYRLVTSEGRALDGDSGLTMQGIEDGEMMTVSAGVDDPVPTVYDDVVEAMTDVVEHDLRPWAPAAGRRTALGASALLMALGAVALLVQGDAGSSDGASLAATAAGVVALVLVVGAVVLSRLQQETEAALTVAWMSVGYATVAGLLLAPSDQGVGGLAASAGGGMLLAGVVAVVGLDAGRTLLVPAAVVGAVLLAAGLVVGGTGASASVLLTVVMTFVVLAGSIFPWLALGMTGTNAEQIYTTADIVSEDVGAVDAGRVSSDARVAHEILVAISATVGLLLVLVAPLAVSRGIFGTVLAVVACLVVMFRTRQYRTGSEVLVGLVSGIVGLASVSLSLLAMRPEWRPTVAVVLAAAGAVLLALTLLPSGPSVRRGRFGDVVETAALVSLLPLLVVASGLFDAITS